MNDAQSDLGALRAQNTRLAQALAEADSRFGLVLEATNDGVWDWDLSTDVAFFSRRWKMILGYEEDEIEDTGAAFFELVHEQDRAKVQAAIEAHFERDVPYLVEFRMRAKDDSWREIQARGQCQRDADGKPTRMAGIHTDVTERRQRERERVRKQDLIEIQRDTIRALGVPILQVWSGILCLPIIGAVDDERATDMTVELLERVASTATRFAILDLTGAQFRSETVQYLARMARSLRLIGTQAVFCGISPQTARILVDMRLDLGDVPTHRDLGAALRACLASLPEAR